MSQYDYYKYGYYLVGNRITVSKLEALEWCQSNQTWPTFHYHDEIFSSYDWSIEPTESLEVLYQSRAKQLREQYDYLVLMYSGGSDSHNMLMSFLSQGIYPNEIAFFYHSLSDSDHIINQEWHQQTSNRLEPILEKYPMIKFRRIDISGMVLDFMQKEIDNIPYFGVTVSPNNSFRSTLNSLVKDWVDIKTQGKSFRILYGVDKPRIRFDGQHYVFNFYEIWGNANADRAEFDDQEMFYWSPESAKILIKQSHVVKRYWQSNVHDWKNMNCRFSKNLGTIFDHDNAEVMHLIYPWCHGIFLTWRPKNNWYGERDRFILQSNNEIANKYREMIKSVENRIKKQYFNDSLPHKGLVGILSKNYFLG